MTELDVSAREAFEILRVATGAGSGGDGFSPAPGPFLPGLLLPDSRRRLTSSLHPAGTLMPTPTIPASQSVSQLLRPQVKPAASALSLAVDGLLCHPQRQDPTGLRQGGVLELSGPPGIGKTAAAIGLAFDARRKALRRGDEAMGVLLVGALANQTKPRGRVV